MRRLGVYIHIPFCVSKCSYCDFLSYSGQSELYGKYTDFLVNEILSYPFAQSLITTVFIGGGTPTSLPLLEMHKVLEAVNSLPLARDAEITVECNPGTLTWDYLQQLREYGVNRLSIGLQSTCENELNAIGRTHTYIDFLKNYKTARKSGFMNTNIDMMFNLPGQSTDSFIKSLKTVVSLSPEHISCYSLTPSENTPLWQDLQSGKAAIHDDVADRLMYHAAKDLLKSNGYIHYEISNFCKPGYLCKHNLDCWLHHPYIGFGLGAHSFDGKSRWASPSTFEKYFNKDKIECEVLSKNELHSEAMILGLRLVEGICDDDFFVRHGFRPSIKFAVPLKLLSQRGLIQLDGRKIMLTSHGLDLANQVFLCFMDEA